MGFSTQTPMLNMAPKGFKPGRITKSFLMCPGNVEYYLADKLVPFFHAGGLSPNHVTLLNCFWVRIPSIYLFLQGDYVMFVILLLAQQVLDCADGQLARRHNSRSEYGEWLDHFTDQIYGSIVAFLTLINVLRKCGSLSLPFLLIVSLIAIMGRFGVCTMEVKKKKLRWDQLNTFQTMGVVQEWFLSYIYILVYSCFYTMDCLM
jgi:phosphatidylglycerophosphate synthase